MARAFKNILIPLSLREGSDSVLRYGHRFAKENQGKVTLLHVVPTQSYRLMGDVYRPDESGGANQDYAAKVSQERLEAFARQHLEGVSSEIVVRSGSNAAKAVLEAEKDFDTDLVVIGKSGASELGARLQGGLIEKLIRSSPCAVLSVTGQPEAETHYLAPVDFDRKSITMARLAGNFASTMQGKVTLLHVLLADSVALELKRELYGLPSDGPVNLLQAEKGAKARLEELAKKELGGVPYDTMVVVGVDVATSILEVEGANRPGMILMATAGYTGFFQFVLGSAAETIARRASCSVITLRLA